MQNSPRYAALNVLSREQAFLFPTRGKVFFSSNFLESKKLIE